MWFNCGGDSAVGRRYLIISCRCSLLVSVIWNQNLLVFISALLSAGAYCKWFIYMVARWEFSLQKPWIGFVKVFKLHFPLSLFSRDGFFFFKHFFKKRTIQDLSGALKAQLRQVTEQCVSPQSFWSLSPLGRDGDGRASEGERFCSVVEVSTQLVAPAWGTTRCIHGCWVEVLSFCASTWKFHF